MELYAADCWREIAFTLLRPTPIFDTNVFGDVQRALISQSDWKYLLRHRPGHGWPLSSVTALELLAGIDAASPQNFIDVKERIALAYHLSSGRILEDPRFLLCKDLLRIPFPPDQLPPFAPTISRYMDVIRRANSLEQLLKGLPYKGRMARLDATSILSEVMAGPKKEWVAAVERMADETYPGWRELFQQTGKRLPPEMRKELEPRSAWQAQRQIFIRGLLDWLRAGSDTVRVAELEIKLDAVLEFTIFVTREFLLRNYSPEKHQSDVFDQFQLQYLAFERFIIVSRDPDLRFRTRLSPQSARIMPFDQFLGTL
jgi:hypothetical protein